MRGPGRAGIAVCLIWMAALVSGCAGAALRADIHRDGWLLVETPHIALRTDLERDDAIERAKQLEHYWQALARMYGVIVPGTPSPVGQFPVIHFKRRGDFRRIARYAGGFVFPAPYWMDEAIAVTWEGSGDAILLHELTHVFNHHHFSGLPVWAGEGLATFYETLTVRDGEAIIGALPREYLGYWRTPRWLANLDELRHMKYEQFHEDAHEKANYFSAWKLVHLLSTTSPDRLRRFRAYLVALGHTRTSEEAWALAFGDLPATELARDYQLYHQRDDLRGWAKPFQWPAPVVPRVRPLRAGEAHVLWAVLLVRHGERAAAEQQLQLLAAVDPDWPELRYWRALLLRPPDSLKLLREYVARVPKDGRGWRALVTREIDDGLPASYIGLDGAVPPALVAIEGDVRNLIQHASDPLSLNLIGWYFALRQNPVTGLNFAIRALQARPRCGPCWDTAGLLYFQAGKVHEALKAQERAASLYAERAPPDVLARLRRFRAAAAAASAATR